MVKRRRTFKISHLISDLKLIANGVAAESFENTVFKQVDQGFDSAQTKEYLIRLLKTVIDDMAAIKLKWF